MAFLPYMIRSGHKKPFCTVLTSNPSTFSSTESKFSFMSKPKYECQITYGLGVDAMHTSACFPDTIAGGILVNGSVIQPSWKIRIERENLLNYIQGLGIPWKQTDEFFSASIYATYGQTFCLTSFHS